MTVLLLVPAATADQELKPGQVRIVMPGPNDAVLKKTPVSVRLPRVTPYAGDAKKEQLFLKGYCLGYLDAVNPRFT